MGQVLGYEPVNHVREGFSYRADNDDGFLRKRQQQLGGFRFAYRLDH